MNISWKVVSLVLSLTAVGITVAYAYHWQEKQKELTYTYIPELSPEVNAANAAFVNLDNKQYQWKEKEWETAKKYAQYIEGDSYKGTQNEIAFRMRAIFLVGNQAGCDSCVNEKIQAEWQNILIPYLNDPSEYIRQAALQTLYYLKIKIPKNMANDPSLNVQYTWKNTYGKEG